jgi:hypothetical protein
VARLFALLIALSTGVSGILPAGDGYRCVVMNQRMAPGADCCPRCTTPTSAIGRACCEFIRGATPDPRGPHSVEEPRLHPAPLVAILPLTTSVVCKLGSTARSTSSTARGQPPGEHLHEFSQILLV